MWLYAFLLFIRADYSQETGCNEGFLCGDKICIESSWFCDGEEDCWDGSDEIPVEKNISRAKGVACRQSWDVCLLPRKQASKFNFLCKAETECTDGFLCNNGKCLNPGWFCDGSDACGDGSDEIKNLTEADGSACRQFDFVCLLPETQASKSDLLCKKDAECRDAFLCTNGKCIDLEDYCNGYNDCGDGSDEIKFKTDMSEKKSIACRQHWNICLLPESQASKSDKLCKKATNCSDGFLCGNGKCIDPYRYCNGDDDCGDGSDDILQSTNTTDVKTIPCRQHWSVCHLPESQASKSNILCTKDINCHDGFLCGNGDCVAPYNFCDGYEHCSDGSDEVSQVSGNGDVICESTYSFLTCALPKRHVCDVETYCMGCIDECLCVDDESTVFLDNKCFRCLSNHSIVVPLAAVCDGRFDCPDLTDECLCEGKEKPKLCDAVYFGQKKKFPFSLSCSLNGSESTKPNQICDNKKHCTDGIDEENCRTISNFARNTSTSGVQTGSADYYCEYLEKNVTACDRRPECRKELYREECSSCLGERPPYCNHMEPDVYIFSCSWLSMTTTDDVCDGKIDCAGNEDEIGCANWFYCDTKAANKPMHRITWDTVCDTVEDCEDGSDEGAIQNCPYFFCHDTGEVKYISNKQVCDGTQDCSKGSDECQDRCINSVFSDTKLMIKNGGAEAIAWLISFAALLGNTAVIMFTIKDLLVKKRKNDPMERTRVINKALILNLSLADLMVGMYTVGIVIEGSRERGQYCLADQAWRSSQTCSAIGALLVTGSQQSVFTMVIITLFRVLSTFKLHAVWQYRKIGIAIFATWVVSISIAVIPVIPQFEDYFIGSVWYEGSRLFTTIPKQKVANLTNWLMLMYKNSNSTELNSHGGSWKTLEKLIANVNSNFTVGRKFGFYSTHTVCLPMLFPDPKTVTAWWYSLMIIFINFVSFIVVFIGSVAIYKSATSRNMATTDAILKKRSSAMQVKLSRIVITDFCCWMPVCIMGFLQLFGVGIPLDAYLPIALVVIPINSSLNPFLYSNVPDIIWAKMKAAYARLKARLSRPPDTQESQNGTQTHRVIESTNI